MAKPKPKKADIITLIRARKPKGGDEPGTVTTPEIRRAMGCGVDTARAITDELEAEGKLVKAMVMRDTGWGVVQPVKGFRIVA
ncbi:MAG: hypothetical protein AMXMBFR53_36510 [Gemmatimonadota bacterium]